MEYIRITKEAD